jgi:hypothetical protein
LEKNDFFLPEEEVKLDGGEKTRHKVAMSELRVTKRNAHFSSPSSILTSNTHRMKKSMTDPLITNEEEIDMEIYAVLRPVKIVYRPD